jgi:hypothetical protein
MKRKMLFAMIALMVSVGLSAQVFIIERGSNSLTYSNIKAAVDALLDNDRLYLPPGIHSLNGYNWEGYNGTLNSENTLVITKKVSVYGGGYANGANSTIIADGEFVIGQGASGSYITGMQFNNTFRLDNVSNCSVTRCGFNSTLYLSGVGNNLNISECDFGSYVQNNISGYINGITSNISANFSKCIFRFYGTHLQNVNIYNSIFLWFSLAPPVFENSLIQSNIFIINETTTNTLFTAHGSNNSYANNLWVGGYPTSDASLYNTFHNEIEREPYANVFVDAESGDYHLKAGCNGIAAGVDGTDVGIYGTSVPFKESRLPSIPNFVVKSIAPETNADGNLPVYIKIEAQNQ